MPPNQTFVGGDRDDRLATALEVGGAILAAARQIRILGAGGTLEVSLAARDYYLWALAKRRIRVDGKRGWHMGDRSELRASGEGANEAKSAESLLPTPRKTSCRQLMTFLSAPGQVCDPQTMKADASSGLSRIGYRDSGVVRGSCEADGRLLPRLI